MARSQTMNISLRNLTILTILSSILIVVNCKKPQLDEIHGYHFHVYFFDKVHESVKEAKEFWNTIDSSIKSGFLKNCVVKPIHNGPFGPHQVGNYETCCNHTAISKAISFFMLNHGNLTVLFHPLTRYEKRDHSEREMFLGPRIPINLDVLSNDLLDFTDTCTVKEQGGGYKKDESKRVNAGNAPLS